jgi:heme/copper-type cytochrome/quinol oxidase subunit 2
MRSLLSILALSLALAAAPALAGAQAASSGTEIRFLQLSDTHWGFNNPKINPDFAGTLQKAIAQVNALQGTPDFLVFSGDETHTTDDPAVRRQRMQQFKDIIKALNVGEIKFLPGEHDAALDNAQAYREFFGEPYYTFDVKGVHFIALDNVSDGNSSLGDQQLAWLQGVLAGFDKGSQIILFAHRPLLDVYPQWDWRTKDGAKALAMLSAFKNVTLFYGHIHQLRKDANGWLTQYAARGLMFPLPAPGSVPNSAPIAWDPQHPYRGLGFRAVTVNTVTHEVTVTEYPITPPATSMTQPAASATVSIVAQRGKYTPSEIHVPRGVPVTLVLTSLDTTHGFSVPDLDIDAAISPGQPTKVSLNVAKAGQYDFVCDRFCGEGHESMVGKIIVE